MKFGNLEISDAGLFTILLLFAIVAKVVIEAFGKCS